MAEAKGRPWTLRNLVSVVIAWKPRSTLGGLG